MSFLRMEDHDAPQLTRKGLATRDRILAATERVFSRRGRAGTTVRAICDTAGIKRTAFYRYFPDVTALLDAVGKAAAERVTQAFLTRFEGRPRGYMRLRSCLGHVLTMARDDPDHARLLLALSRETPLIRSIVITEIRTELRAEGHAEADRKAALIAAGLFGFLDQLSHGDLALLEIEAVADLLMKSVR